MNIKTFFTCTLTPIALTSMLLLASSAHAMIIDQPTFCNVPSLSALCLNTIIEGINFAQPIDQVPMRLLENENANKIRNILLNSFDPIHTITINVHCPDSYGRVYPAIIKRSDGTILAAMSNDKSRFIEIWNINTNTSLYKLDTNDGGTHRILVTLDDSHFAIGTMRNTKIYNVKTKECLHTIDIQNPGFLDKLDDNHLVWANIFGKIEILTINPFQRLLITEMMNDITWVERLDDNFLIAITVDHPKSIVSLNPHMQLKISEEWYNTFNILSKLGDNYFALSTKKAPYNIQIQNLDTNECLCLLEGHTAEVHTAIKFGNKQLATASCDGIIKAWNLNTRECSLTLTQEPGWMRLTMLDDTLLSSVSESGSIKIWDLGTDLLLLQILLIAHLQEIAKAKESIQLHDDWKTILPTRWAERFAHILI